ncbi:MAG: type II toxin-antitoxin system RelE/ParE family toxin [Clostridia bacterium]|nr:type II toxin-antitoxin system RelE/ParE family toxin [Clostridia bacterium]
MSKYQVLLTPESTQEIRDIHSYIANTLLVPETAKKQVNRIMETIKSLDEMPERYSLYEKEPWHTRGLRKVSVDNFIVFYYVNNNSSEVVIFHVFYGGRNITELMK